MRPPIDAEDRYRAPGAAGDTVPILALDQVTSGYAGVPIVQSVSLAIARGESLAIVGRNGVGKTTLVKAIMALNRVSGGTIAFKSRRIDNADPSTIARAGLGYVPQGRGIFGRLTVAENLAMGELVGDAKPPYGRERVLDWFPVLRHRLEQKAGTLSGGEQQMLAIARVLVGNPDFLLLDEPSEGVQPSIVEHIAEVLCQQIEEQAMTVFLVEQNLELVKMVSERCLVMDHGEIVATVAPEAFANPDVAQRYLAI